MSGNRDFQPSDMFDKTAWKMFWRIVENCPVAVFATDAVGRHLFVNRPWSELTGLPRDEAVGWGWDRVVHPDDVATVGNHWRRLVTHGDGFAVQVRLVLPGGAARRAIIQTVATSAGDGRRRFVGTLTPAPIGAPTAGDAASRDIPDLDLPAHPDSHTHPQGQAGRPGADDAEHAGAPLASEEAALDFTAFDADFLDEQLLGHELFGREDVGAEEIGPEGILPGGPDRYGLFDGLGGYDPFDDAARAFRESADDPLRWTDAPAGPGDPESPDHVAGADRSADRSADPTSAPDGPVLGHPAGTGYPLAGPPPRWPEADDAVTRRWTVPLPRRPVPGEPTPGRSAPRETPEERSASYPRGALPPGAEWRAAVVLHRDEDGDLHPRPAHADGGHPAEGCGCLFAEMRRIEEACRDRERWLTTLLAELTTAVLIADRDGSVVAVNQMYCDLFDLADSPVDVVGTDCRRHLRPRAGLVDDPSGFAARLDTLLRRRRTLRREPVMFADGRVFERSHIALAAADGYRGHLWLYSDVTDRRILEAEIEGLISGL
ncbi:PAS domain-containing protein [Frankia alni]|uniref:Two-component hybrid sensor and regulator n=3 Tax=Frankia TaxID=1854 RepID=Q0RR44_FRAAA|nr:putative Two-component hybrid sensor and regulator [Frankia alni ACN14a]